MDDIVGIHRPVRMIAMPNPKLKKGKGYAKFAAVALELGIWAYADKRDKAMSNLVELVELQIDGYLSSRIPELIEFPAKQKWFELWDELQEASKSMARKPGRPKKIVKENIWMELRRSVTPSYDWKEYDPPRSPKAASAA